MLPVGVPAGHGADLGGSEAQLAQDVVAGAPCSRWSRLDPPGAVRVGAGACVPMGGGGGGGGLRVVQPVCGALGGCVAGRL